LTTDLAVSSAAACVGVAVGDGGSGVAVGASGVAVAASAVAGGTTAGGTVAVGGIGDGINVGFAGVLVKVGRSVFVGTSVPTGPRATRVVVQLARATVSNSTPITAQIR
jgi:hypothetical protein